MGQVHRIVAFGDGWEAVDVVCDSGPGDRPFEEQHRTACIALVTDGTFICSGACGPAVLVPGTLLVGNAGAHFECRHDHSRGDRCLSFQLTPGFLEDVAAGLDHVRTTAFTVTRVAATARSLSLHCAALAARERPDRLQLEELAVQFAAHAFKHGEYDGRSRTPASRDIRRVSETIRWLEDHCHRPVRLSQLAAMANVSRYHFLRLFKSISGQTPHQYILGRRLALTCTKLRASDRPITAIACETGFGDLSTFNRHFHRAVGQTPGQYRSRPS